MGWKISCNGAFLMDPALCYAGIRFLVQANQMPPYEVPLPAVFWFHIRELAYVGAQRRHPHVSQCLRRWT